MAIIHRQPFRLYYRLSCVCACVLATSTFSPLRAQNLVSEDAVTDSHFLVAHKSDGTALLLKTDELDSITFLPTTPREDLDAYNVPARWNAGLQPCITLHDDDAIDKFIPTSWPPAWTEGGYATTLYPLLASLGLKGCLSVEGQRVGFVNTPAVLSENGRILKHLQDHHGWELMCHTMTARYVANVYAVDNVESELANEILSKAKYAGRALMGTTCIVDTLAGINYMVNSSLTGWEEMPREYIRPYVMDYKTNRVIAYNKTFPVDYQWGYFMTLARQFGFDVNSGVMPATSGSHAVYPLICAYVPNLFELSGGLTFCNYPPLPSYVNRRTLEVGGEQNIDNSYDAASLAYYKSLVDEAVKNNAWLIFYMHGYRPCWLNSVESELQSRGGTYPDEWVHPILPEDDIIKAFETPPARLGISSWEEWHPCPGTRLYMLYELLQYAKERGMLNITSRQGFERFGNLISEGYYNKKGQAGQDSKQIIGTRSNYPHHVIGADGSEDFLR